MDEKIEKYILDLVFATRYPSSPKARFETACNIYFTWWHKIYFLIPNQKKYQNEKGDTMSQYFFV